MSQALLFAQCSAAARCRVDLFDTGRLGRRTGRRKGNYKARVLSLGGLELEVGVVGKQESDDDLESPS